MSRQAPAFHVVRRDRGQFNAILAYIRAHFTGAELSFCGLSLVALRAL